MLSTRVVLSLLTISACAGCSAPAPQEADASESAIIRGETSGPEDNAVVRLVVGARGGEVCSGTLIAPNAVLTARHCVAERSPTAPRPTCRVQGSDGTVVETTPDQLYVGNVDVRTVEVTVGATYVPWAAADARGVELFADAASTICGHDVAVILLDRSLTVAAPRAVRRTAPLATEDLTAVGWGFTDLSNVNGGRDLPTKRLRRSGVRMLAPGGEVLTYTKQNGSQVVAGSMTGEFLASESVCNGDSGGPLLDAEGKIAGVTSRRVNMTSQRCVDSPIVFSHPGSAQHQPIIDAALARARTLRGP